MSVPVVKLTTFATQPILPDDEDLRKDNPHRIPAEARRIMEEMGIDVDFEENELDND